MALVNGLFLLVIDEEGIFVYLVLQGKVEGEVFGAFIAVDLHFGGVLICLKVFDDIGEPDWQAVIPAIRGMQWYQKLIHQPLMLISNQDLAKT